VVTNPMFDEDTQSEVGRDFLCLKSKRTGSRLDKRVEAAPSTDPVSVEARLEGYTSAWRHDWKANTAKTGFTLNCQSRFHRRWGGGESRSRLMPFV